MPVDTSLRNFAPVCLIPLRRPLAAQMRALEKNAMPLEIWRNLEQVNGLPTRPDGGFMLLRKRRIISRFQVLACDSGS